MKKEIIQSDIGESLVKAVHSSGLQIFIYEKPQFSSSYAIFGTKYGSIDTRFSKNGEEMIDVPEGIAHFLEHKLFESEEGDAFTLYAKTGASANAFTSFDRTCYLFSCAENFSENLDILLNFVQSPYFTEKTVQKEQGIIGQEIKMYDDSPSWRVMFNMLMAMYNTHPVRIDIAGTVESIAHIDYNLLYKCYETFYNPSNMYICIAGNVDADEVLNQIEKGIKDKKPVEITRGEFTEPKSVLQNYVEQKLEVSMPMFCFGFKQDIETPKRSLKTKLCMALLLEIICGDASPLYASLVRDGLINDEFGSEYFNGYGYAAMLFEGESKDPEEVANRIKTEIERLKTEGIDKRLFSAVKCGLYGDLIRRFDSVEGITMSLVDGVMGDYNIFDELKLLKSISVENVMKRLANFDVENTVLSVVKGE